jgi:hypothetical protein
MTEPCHNDIITLVDVVAPDPPKPDEVVENGLRSKIGDYTKFADRMICVVYGKSRYGASSTATLFDDLISPSQEAFTLLLYRKWI